MERHRGKALAFSVALSCLVTTTPSRSQSAHTTLIEWRHGTPEHSLPVEPFSLERGEDVPKDLLDGLAERADSYRYLLDRFTCTERIRRRGKQPVLRDYLLVGVEDVQKLREIRFAGERRVKDPDNPMPPPMAWSLLFSEDYQPHFVYRYLGYGLGGFDGGHRILFRGNRWFEKGKDIREWEGVATVDAAMYEVMSIEAMPRLYVELLEMKREKRRKSLPISIGIFEGWGKKFHPLKALRTRRAPVVPFLQVGFDEIDLRGSLMDGAEQVEAPETARLPAALRFEMYREGDDGKVKLMKSEGREYSSYRFFDVDARTLGYGGQ